MKKGSLLVVLAALLGLPAVTSAATIVAADIAIDTTWTAASSPYIVQFPFTNASTYEPLTVRAGATLTIEPGVVVKFASYNGMEVRGTLRALGTAAAPIYFTSLADDAVGGDSDGIETTPAATQWVHLHFDAGSIGEFDHAAVRYGGQTLLFSPMTGIANDGGTVSIDHTRLSHNGYDGLAIFSGITSVRNSEFEV